MNSPKTYSPASRYLIALAALVIVIAGLKIAQSLFVPFLLAGFITIILMGPLGWLEQQKIPHWAAVLIVMFIAVVTVLLVSSLVGNSIEQFRLELPSYQSRINNELSGVFSLLESWGIPISGSSLRDILSPGRIMQLTGDLLNNIGGLLGNGFLILLTVVFILAEASSFKSKIRRAIKDPEPVIEKIDLFAQSAERYMAIKAAISALTGILVAIFLSVLGVDFAILWGLLAFFLNFVPNIGSVFAAVPAVLLAFVQFGGTTALLVIAGYAALNIIIGNVVEPRFMGKGVGLSTLVVFLSLVFWGWVLGPVGMLLSVPLTMMAKIALEKNPDTHWIAVLLGNDAPSDQ